MIADSSFEETVAGALEDAAPEHDSARPYDRDVRELAPRVASAIKAACARLLGENAAITVIDPAVEQAAIAALRGVTKMARRQTETPGSCQRPDCHQRGETHTHEIGVGCTCPRVPVDTCGHGGFGWSSTCPLHGGDECNRYGYAVSGALSVLLGEVVHLLDEIDDYTAGDEENWPDLSRCANVLRVLLRNHLVGEVPSAEAVDAAAKVMRKEFDERSHVPPQARYIAWEEIQEETRQMWRDGVRNPLRAAYLADGIRLPDPSARVAGSGAPDRRTVDRESECEAEGTSREHFWIAYRDVCTKCGCVARVSP